MYPFEFDFTGIVYLLSLLLRTLGLIVFGVGSGWFALSAFRDKPWQLQIAVFLGFLGFVGVAIRFLAPAALGGFTLGAGAALLIWGLRGAEED